MQDFTEKEKLRDVRCVSGGTVWTSSLQNETTFSNFLTCVCKDCRMLLPPLTDLWDIWDGPVQPEHVWTLMFVAAPQLLCFHCAESDISVCQSETSDRTHSDQVASLSLSSLLSASSIFKEPQVCLAPALNSYNIWQWLLPPGACGEVGTILSASI